MGSTHILSRVWHPFRSREATHLLEREQREEGARREGMVVLR